MPCACRAPRLDPGHQRRHLRDLADRLEDLLAVDGRVVGSQLGGDDPRVAW